mgnify:CR=1 FL=1
MDAIQKVDKQIEKQQKTLDALKEKRQQLIREKKEQEQKEKEKAAWYRAFREAVDGPLKERFGEEYYKQISAEETAQMAVQSLGEPEAMQEELEMSGEQTEPAALSDMQEGEC